MTASGTRSARQHGPMGRFTVAAALGDLVLPATCAGCRRPGEPWCPGCARTVRDLIGVRWSPTPPPAGLPPTWTAAAYDGPLRHAVVAWKDEGRRDLDRVLRPLLREALAAAVAGSTDLGAALRAGVAVPVVPAPSAAHSRRARGEQPLARLVATALSGTRGLRVLPALEHQRRVADQAGLGRGERAANLHGALRVAPRYRPRVVGCPCLLVDDVVTTGATLAEAARALRAAGATQLVAVTVAATRRNPRGSGVSRVGPRD